MFTTGMRLRTIIREIGLVYLQDSVATLPYRDSMAAVGETVVNCALEKMCQPTPISPTGGSFNPTVASIAEVFVSI